MKNGKKGLTNDKKDDIIVKCIIIARTAGILTKSDKLYSSNLHKKAIRIRGKRSGKQPIPERYHYFEWSD